jgi:thiol-disulfide isomerase/thioredoxin
MKWLFPILIFVSQLPVQGAETKPQLQPITIEALKSRIQQSQQNTLVNLWATWCGPCVKEFPVFLELQESKKNLDVILVSMDYESQKSEVLEFLKKQKVGFTTYTKSGNESQFINGFLAEWQGALPVTVLYGPKGKTIKVWQGEVTKAKITEYLK